jgi:peptidoglycan/xylan/chitin deacetylase (PgdA/CDA1 family)
VVELVEEERDDVELSVSGEAGRLRLADILFQTPEADWMTDAAVPPAGLLSWNLSSEGLADAAVATDIPVLYGGEPLLRFVDGEVELGLDVLGSVFFLLTRYEEAAGRQRDERERFPASASLAFREGFLDRPLANEYVEVLWRVMARIWPRLGRRSRSFAERPTHDVDFLRCRQPTLRTTLDRTVRDAVFRREPSLALARLSAFARPARADPFDTFDLLMDASERAGMRSTFYVIAGRTGGSIDGDYELEDPFARRLLRRIHERGHEVGLHGSYGTFRDAEATRAELERLKRVAAEEGIDQEAWGGRQHFLRWENPTTWRNYEKAGLAHDSTLAFAERAGFRAGTCFEYPVFDLVEGKQLRLRERPLIAMDASLVRYAGLRGDAVVAEVERLRERCRRYEGEFVLLWHNDWLYSNRGKRLYRRVLGP